MMTMVPGIWLLQVRCILETASLASSLAQYNADICKLNVTISRDLTSGSVISVEPVCVVILGIKL